MDRTREQEARAVVPVRETSLPVESTWSAPWRWLMRDDFLAMDMYETDEGVVIEMAVPGVAPEDIDIRAVGDTLTVRGELKRTDPENASYILQERSYGRFQRTIQLPGLTTDKVDATLENGVLRLTLTKPEGERARKIKVKSHK